MTKRWGLTPHHTERGNKMLQNILLVIAKLTDGVQVNFSDELGWNYDLENEILTMPNDYETQPEPDLPHKMFMQAYCPDKIEYFANVPHWVFKLYHEIGHHHHDPEYDERNLRKILAGLAEISEEVALAGYYELPSEVDASHWAIAQIMEDMENAHLNGTPYWWATPTPCCRHICPNPADNGDCPYLIPTKSGKDCTLEDAPNECDAFNADDETIGRCDYCGAEMFCEPCDECADDCDICGCDLRHEVCECTHD